ncbi:MAG: 30S ribosomal protein S2 [Anaerolineae bacterium]|nr:30S ribosomal protein S2 [Anaerolineae bacterium]
MPVPPMKSLLEAGVHFGHRTRRWNPKMKPFIFTERNGIHIIDLQQTITRLNQAYELVKESVASGGIILFVGTKRQAQEAVVEEARRCSMPYVENRWLGGTLTNWRTIRQRIDYLLEAERKQARGEFERLIKKEALLREREIVRLNHRLGGLKEMRRLPNYLFVVDVRRDDLAVKEASTLGIPVIAMVDTNCDPDPIDYAIPSNDDAIRALRLMLQTMADAVLEGQAIYSTLQAEEEEVEIEVGEEVSDERYLGPSTLAKIQAAAEAKVEEEAFAIEEEEIVEEAQAEEVSEAVVEAATEVIEATEAAEAEAAAEAEEVAEAEEAAEAEAAAEAEEVTEEEEAVEAEVEVEAAEEKEAVAEEAAEADEEEADEAEKE